MAILSLLDTLASISGSNDKQAKLQEYARGEHGDLLKEVLQLTYDNSKNFYIRKLPEYTAGGMRELQWGLDQLAKLYTREVTGHDAIAHLTGILNMLNDEDAQVICKIIKRDVASGFSEGTINKVWDKLIPELPIMLAQPMKDKFISRIRYPAFAQLKADGARCIAIIDFSDVKLFSRNFKGYYGLESLCEELGTLVEGRWVIDGELVSVDANGNVVDRKTSNGIINKSGKGTISKKEAEQVRFQIWDIVPYDDYFNKGICKTRADVRYASVVELTKNAKYTFAIESTVVNNLAEAKVVFQKYVAQGLEGILLKNMDAPWEDKRSNNQVKFKVEDNADLIVLDIYEGEGKYKGMLGGVTLGTSCGLLKVNCGSGLNDDQRKQYWDKPSEIIGKVVEIKHNGVIRSKSKDLASAFLPIFLFVRNDKNPKDADTLERMDG